jgi:hypothetical protein
MKEFWGAEDQERLTHDDMDEAIEEMLDGAEPMPETITICRYTPMKVVMPDALEWVLETLDDEYGDPDDDYTTPTDVMKEAAQKFLDVIEREYHTWACDMVEKREVDVAAWVKEHRPNWLTAAPS